MILPEAGTLTANDGPMDAEVREFKVRRQLASLRDQAGREIAGARAARYATRREEAGAYLTQPFAAVGDQWTSKGYEPTGRTVRLSPRRRRVADAVPPPPAPLGAISAAMVAAIPFPSTKDPRDYGRYHRAVGAATGTRTTNEDDRNWRPALEAPPLIGPPAVCPECNGNGYVEVMGCTCGVGPGGYYGMHERGCGSEPCPAGCAYRPEAVWA